MPSGVLRGCSTVADMSHQNVDSCFQSSAIGPLKKNIDVESFARKAMLAKDNDFITDESDVIAYTRLIGGGESDTIVFTIEKPGVYIYLCTFPGHSQLMRGKLLIE